MRYAPWLGVLGVIGVVYGALVAFAQHDMKRLVAYSSVSHLGLVVIGIGAFTTISLSGSILQMINHGLSTGALFLLVGVLYERRHTREIDAYGGIAGVVPVTTALFLIATLSSIGLPGLNGFVGEFLDPARDLGLAAPLVGGRGGERRDPLGDLHAHARAARVLEPADARGEQVPARDPARASSSPPRCSSSSWSGSACGPTTCSTGYGARSRRCRKPWPPSRSRVGRRDGVHAVHRRGPSRDRARDRPGLDRVPDPAPGGLRARAAPLVRDARPGRRGGIAVLPPRGSGRDHLRRPLRDLAADRPPGLFLGGSAAVAILVAKPYLQRTGEEKGEFYALLLWGHLGGLADGARPGSPDRLHRAGDPVAVLLRARRVLPARGGFRGGGPQVLPDGRLRLGVHALRHRPAASA